MTTQKVLTHGPWIPEEVARLYKVSKGQIVLHLTGLLAKAIRVEAKETNQDELSVVIGYLEQYLIKRPIPWRRPTTSQPLDVEVSGGLAIALKKNADALELSPEDSAIAILCEVFEIQRPSVRPKGVGAHAPTEPKITLTIPGSVAKAAMEAAYPTRVDSKYILDILYRRLLVVDTPQIPGL